MTAVDILRQVAGIIELRDLPAPSLYSILPAFSTANLHVVNHGDVFRWANEFHTNPHADYSAKGARSWRVEFDTDGLHVQVTGFEHTAAVA